MCSNKKTLLVPLVVLLLMALCAMSAVPIGHDTAGDQDLQGCSEMKGCTEKVCGGLCFAIGSNGIGSCRTEGQSSYCCCQPKPSNSDDFGVH